MFDVAIIGAGPAGAACAIVCAAAGQRTILLERSQFPRGKVCGDCLNPGCWPVLERLGVAGQVRTLPHAPLANVIFVGIAGESLRIALPRSARGEIALKRSLLDQLLVERAIAVGAHVLQETTVTGLQHGWVIQSGRESFRARVLVAADGRNSTVARLLRLLPAARKERIALQRTAPASADFADSVVLRFLPEGYCGVAPIGDGELNVCLVARPESIDRAKEWAVKFFALDPLDPWRSVTPLTRRPACRGPERLLLTGDAARVVEPFTGEGIYYALASGELAARCILAENPGAYPRLHAELYRGRLWINRLARLASLHPRVATQIIRYARHAPGILSALTRRVVETEPLPDLTIAPPVWARR
jgi:geranylgeranyl reductase family protein